MGEMVWGGSGDGWEQNDLVGGVGMVFGGQNDQEWKWRQNN